jgi:8-oxo-dGTP pyrophosphatase MutT (NUDIX family)
VVIYRGKILVLYKRYRNKYEGWVLPKGTVESGETHEETATREVREESGANAFVKKYIDTTHYSFSTSKDVVSKSVLWYLMSSDSYYSKPQREEFFEDSGYYKYNEAIHLLRFTNERQILEKAYSEYEIMRKSGNW